MLLIVGAFLLMLRLEVEFIVVASIVDVSKTRSKHLIFFFFFPGEGRRDIQPIISSFLFYLIGNKYGMQKSHARIYLFTAISRILG